MHIFNDNSTLFQLSVDITINIFAKYDVPDTLLMVHTNSLLLVSSLNE